MTRYLARIELVEQGATKIEMAQFDNLTADEFELWYKVCHKNNN